MRTIKFRAWSITDKIMSYQQPNGYFKGAYYSIDYRALQDVNLGILIQKHNFGSIVLMQFTGLHDKHGKEIFEGDVVRFWGGKGHIIYFETYAQFKIQYGENDLFDIDHTTEIIGNIYENPELI
jgi:uncharacterized phage protein (TIGR01671 family)